MLLIISSQSFALVNLKLPFHIILGNIKIYFNKYNFFLKFVYKQDIEINWQCFFYPSFVLDEITFSHDTNLSH